MIDAKLILACKKQNRHAQRKVYDQLASKLYYTCKRYLPQEDEAQDALSEAFYLIFTKIDQLKETAAFEGWARRITVNQCLSRVRKKVNFNLHLEEEEIVSELIEEPSQQLEEEELLQMVDSLPLRSKTVFHLFAVEGYSHKEIAEKLGISVGTSKSQLSFAKKKLQVLVQKFFYLKNEVK